MTGRALQVLEALRELIEEGAETVCARVEELARTAGLSDSTTRRALAELVDAGCLEPTGERTGGTAVFRITDTPEPWSEARARAESARAYEEEAEAELEPLTEEERLEFARHSAELAHRYGGGTTLPAPEDEGYCLDARHGDGVARHGEAGPRYRYGRLLLCGPCYRARARVRVAIAKPKEMPELADALVAEALRASQNGNGYDGEPW